MRAQSSKQWNCLVPGALASLSVQNFSRLMTKWFYNDSTKV